MKQRLLRFTLSVSLLAMLLGSVWFQQASPVQSQTPNTLKVGYIGTADDDTARGIQLAMNQLNGAGGITAADGEDYLYELVVSESVTPDQVPTAIRLLTEQGVVAIFGPDSDALVTIPENLTAMSSAAVPVIIGATDDAILGQDTAGNVFRAVAPERMYSLSLAKYLVEVREFSRVAIIRQGAQWTNAAIGLRFIFNQELSVDPVLVVEGETSEDVAARNADLLSLNPEAVIMYGDADATLAMLTQLRTSNWQGVFVYRTPGGVFTGDLTAGVISADTWTFGAPATLSATFNAQFAAEYGLVPQPLAASGYDTFFALNSVLRDVGIDPASVRTGLDQFAGLDLVRGTISGEYDERNLSMTVYIYELNGHGGERQLAIYDNGELLPDSVAPTDGGVVIVQPTATPLPTATTAAVSATPIS
jgi:ABC-type branched-subunit amino acid transport system substrate-binding protein